MSERNLPEARDGKHRRENGELGATMVRPWESLLANHGATGVAATVVGGG